MISSGNIVCFVLCSLCLVVLTKCDLQKDTVVEKTLSLVEEGDSSIQLLEANRDLLVCLGNSGSGKSALVQFMFGDNDQMFSKPLEGSEEVDDGEPNYYIVDTSEKISNSVVLSKTIFPDLLIDPATKTAVYDCPGFKDTRNESMDISAAYFVHKVLSHARNIKFVFAVNYNSVTSWGTRHDAMDLFKHITEIFKSNEIIEKYRSSMVLVATKVKSKRTDQAIISSIGKHLIKLKLGLEEMTLEPELKIKMQTLLDIFTKNDFENLGIFRTPDRAGVLSGIEIMQKSKPVLKNLMFGVAKSSATNIDDFPVSIADKSKLVVQKILSQIDTEGIDLAQSIEVNFKNLMRNKIKSSNDIINFKPTIIAVNEKYKQFFNQTLIDNFYYELFKNISPYLTDISRTLYLNIDVKLNHLLIFQRFSNIQKSVPPSWTKPFLDSSLYLSNISEFYQQLHEVDDKLSSPEFQSQKSLYNVQDLENWGKGSNKSGLVITSLNYQQFMSQIRLNTSLDIKYFSSEPYLLEHLNEVVRANLHDTTVITHDIASSSVNVTGTRVNIADCLEKYLLKNTTIKIVASHAVYFDRNIEHTCEGNCNIIIFSPTWHVTKQVKVTLRGKEGLSLSPARSGQAYGENGAQGQAGVPGNNAANFMGWGMTFINVDKLEITSIAGSGGKGQDGGNGANGRDSDYLELEIFWHFTLANTRAKCYVRDWNTRIGTLVNGNCPSFSHSDPVKGGNGGHGGVGGITGSPGKIKILGWVGNPDKFKYIAGTSGGPGLGGKQGQNGIKAKYCNVHSKSRETMYARTLNDACRDHGANRAGDVVYDGSAGVNTLGAPKLVTKSNEIILVEQIIDYKFFLYNLKQRTNSVRFNAINNINKNKQINSELYNLNAFLSEFIRLEKMFTDIEDKYSLQPAYQSYHERLKTYIEEHGSLSNAEKNVFSYLYLTSANNMFNSQVKSSSALITDFTLYLSKFKTMITNLQQKDSKIKMQKLKLITDHENLYVSKFENNIIECRNIITSINIEIRDMLQTTDNSINNLLGEVNQYSQQLSENTKKQVEYREKLIEQKNKRLAASSIGLFASSLHIFGSIGSIMATGIQMSSSLAEAEGSSSPGAAPNPDVKIPSAVNIELLVEDIDVSFIEPIYIQLKNINTSLLAMYVDFNSTVESSEANKDFLSEVKSVIEEVTKFNIEKHNYREVITKVENIRATLKNKIKTSNRNKRSAEKDEKKLKEEKKEQESLDKFNKHFGSLNTAINTGITIHKNYKEDDVKINAVSKIIEKNQEKEQKLREYEKKVIDIFVPLLVKFKSNLVSVLQDGKLDLKSLGSLDYTAYTVSKTLSDLKFTIRQFLNEFATASELERLIEKIDEAFKLVIQIFSRIQEQRNNSNLLTYFAKISTIMLDDNVLSEPLLRGQVNNLKFVTESNIFLQKYNKIISNFKQWVFPFAKFYFQTNLENVPKNLQIATSTYEEKLDNIFSKSLDVITKIEDKMHEFDSSIIPEFHENIINQEFSSKYGLASDPFFVWKNSKFRSEISKLLSGEEVILRADIYKNPQSKNALKFSFIELNLKIANSSEQQMFDKILNNFDVELTHLGSSQYKCNSKYFTIYSDPIKLSYSFQRDEAGSPIRQNLIQSYIIRKSYILSPYTYWKLKLKSVTPQFKFSDLLVFRDKVEVHLVGKGQYLEDQTRVCDNDLEMFYNVDEPRII